MKTKLKKLIPKQKISKVSIFTVGAQKSGTSALHDYLIKHPMVIGGVKKELNFFNHPEKYSRGIQRYHQQFASPFFYQSGRIYIDSTPQYLSTEGVAENIYKYNPEAKIVILLREPVSRVYSAWNMYSQMAGKADEQRIWRAKRAISSSEQDTFLQFLRTQPFPSFDEYVSNELKNGDFLNNYPHAIQNGIYADQIKPYIDLFGIDNVLIFESNDFKNNKLSITNKVLNVAGLSDLGLENNDLKAVHARNYERSISPSTEQILKAFYEPHNERLFALINQKFDW